jgi:F-type H+-transporting ATPase subunit b
MIAPIILAQADILKDAALQFGYQGVLFWSNVISFLIVCAALQKFAYKPILVVLEERRKKIAEGLANAEKIKEQLAEAEAMHAEILNRANLEAQKMIEEARTSAAALAEKRQQQAIAEAEQIISKARDATQMERDRAFAELRREVARLVIETTGKVTGKVLTLADQQRLSEEAAKEIAA